MRLPEFWMSSLLLATSWYQHSGIISQHIVGLHWTCKQQLPPKVWWLYTKPHDVTSHNPAPYQFGCWAGCCKLLSVSVTLIRRQLCNCLYLIRVQGYQPTENKLFLSFSANCAVFANRRPVNLCLSEIHPRFLALWSIWLFRYYLGNSIKQYEMGSAFSTNG
jgi:hypothetical protein